MLLSFAQPTCVTDGDRRTDIDVTIGPSYMLSACCDQLKNCPQLENTGEQQTPATYYQVEEKK
jgi:hypothetical protein